MIITIVVDDGPKTSLKDSTEGDEDGNGTGQIRTESFGKLASV